MFECPECGKTYSRFRYFCRCGSVLLWKGKTLWNPEGEGVWRYSGMLPPVKERISMGEGWTPLVKNRDFVRKYPEMYYKFEGDNPTGSFKDRGTALVISHALGEGYGKVGVASTGNMGASVAAYSAYANISAEVFVPEDTPPQKITQIIAYGARVRKVKGTFSECFSKLWENRRKYYIAMTGVNPYYLEGEKTVAFEIFEEIGVPDTVVVPVGTGGLFTAVWKGFKELKQAGASKKLPVMVGVQAEGFSPIVRAWEEGLDRFPMPDPGRHTIASSIAVKEPFNGWTAIDAVNESKGFFCSVTDNQILRAMKKLAAEGIFAEPASAATLAAVEKEIGRTDERIVLLVTGHGLKQPAAYARINH